MGFDYFTIHALAQEVQERIGGKRVFRAGSGRAGLAFACDRTGQVCAWVGGGGYLCFLPEKWPAELADWVGAERYLLHARVKDVWPDKRDRIIRVRLERRDREGGATYGQLVYELIHPRCQVILVSEETGEVLGLWKGQRKAQRVLVGKPYAPPPPQERLLPGEDEFGQFARAIGPEKGAIGIAGARLLVGMDRSTFAELLHRAGLQRDMGVGDLSDDDVERLWQMAVTLYENPPEGGAFVWQEEGQYRFSALEPTRIRTEVLKFPTVSEAILEVQGRNREAERETRRIQELRGRLRAAARKLDRKVQALRQDIAEAGGAEELEKKGNVLFAQLKAVKPGEVDVELPDIYDISEQARVRIELDPRRTPAENASWFLKTARKYLRRRQMLPERLKRCEAQVQVLEGFLQELGRGGELDSQRMEQWLMENGLAARKEFGKKQQGETAHPRRYRTSDGWRVWAGRSNRENDVLTHRLAAQDDYWFHAYGYPGSHVVLRREGRKEEPSRQTLEEVARVAAYWSKGRTASKVAVVYTLVKYVSKPRGGNPGQAVVRREKTIMVEPGLLPEEDKGQYGV